MLIQAVDTCLSSKVVSQNCETISPMAVDAVLGIIDPLNATNVDLRDIKVWIVEGKTTNLRKRRLTVTPEPDREGKEAIILKSSIIAMAKHEEAYCWRGRRRRDGEVF